MKKTYKIIISLLLISFVLPNLVFAQAVYYNSMKHYSLTVPSGWEEIKKSVIDDINFKQKDVQYTGGFQLKNKNGYINYPYILIQESDEPITYKDVEIYLNNTSLQDSIKNTVEADNNLKLDNIKSFFDKDQSIVFMNSQIDIEGVGKVTSLSSLFLGKKSVIALHFYSTFEGYSEYLPIFNSVISSFKYDKDYIFDKTEMVSESSTNIMSKGLSGGIIGIIIAFFVFGLNRLFSLFKKNK